jgi:hypothetical protein
MSKPAGRQGGDRFGLAPRQQAVSFGDQTAMIERERVPHHEPRIEFCGIEAMLAQLACKQSPPRRYRKTGANFIQPRTGVRDWSLLGLLPP